MNTPVRTTCPYCGVGCGVLVSADASGPTVTGDELHPANFGRLCSKGSALAETLGLEGRLLTPRILGREAHWDEALSFVADGFSRIIAEHGPDSVAFYVSGQFLTEDYYVANKLMKGYIGSANIDTNSRLCMASAVAAHIRVFGEDVVPVSYADVEIADLIVLVGSNTAWCHPVLFQRIAKVKEARPELKIVVIDPRATPTTEVADLHLPLKPGTDVWLFNGLLSFLQQHGVEDRRFIDEHTRGSERALAVAHNTAGDTAAVARQCGLRQSMVEDFFRLFARTLRTITVFSQGVNQSSSGTDKATSIINCHLLTGRIGRPGAGPFSITGQPNAMGGREVGGMANMLAAHMTLDDAEDRRKVQAFWRSPVIAQKPGLKAVDLFDAVHAGRVKALWIAATNPVVSMPNANRVRTALERCELVVVSDCMAHTDTAAHAHVLLPAAAWGEKEGTVTNSERCISRQRTFLAAPGEAKPDWWMFSQVAKRMGFAEGFAYESPHEIFVEHAQLSAAGNEGARAFNIGGLGSMTAEEYAGLVPTRWPVVVDAACTAVGRDDREADYPVDRHDLTGSRGAEGGGAQGSSAEGGSAEGGGAEGGTAESGSAESGSAESGSAESGSAESGSAESGSAESGTGTVVGDNVRDNRALALFRDGRFFHPDRRARFIATEPRAPVGALDAEYPLVLNTGRIRDQWHTMSRSGKSARLMAHLPEPFVDMHAQDALMSGVRVGEFVRVITQWGSMVARLRSSGEMPRRMIFVPMHWNGTNAAEARVGALVNPAVDPLSGEPEFKHTPARVTAYVVAWQGFILSRQPVVLNNATWWSMSLGAQFTRYELAGRRVFGDWSAWARQLLRVAPDCDSLEYVDRSTGVYRAAHLIDDRLEACVFLSPRPDLPPRTWVSSLFDKTALDDVDRAGLLTGAPRDARADAGAVVCSCFGVGRNTILAAIGEFGLNTPQQIGQHLRAGTNCGSCVPELRALCKEMAAETV